jgi:tryptophan synthase alpha chain
MSKSELRIANCELDKSKSQIPNPTSHLARSLAPGHALIPYLTACDPTFEASLDAAIGAAEGGAAALEIGLPFSDPVADGPVIQEAHQRAIAAGGGPARTLGLLREFRRRSDVPVVLFTYLNPVLAFGPERFARAARQAGAQGILLLDLPPGEEPEVRSLFARNGLDCIPIVTPNTSESRLPEVLEGAGGFVYLVSRSGVTGTHAGAAGHLEGRVAALRHRTVLPVAVGFGVKSPADVRAIWLCAEAAVVGSALVSHLNRSAPEAAREAARSFVQSLLPPPQEPEGSRSLP